MSQIRLQFTDKIEMAAAMQWYNVFVGSETGFLKGVNTQKKYFENVNRLADTLDRDQEICAMCWHDPAETSFYCGLKNRHIKRYDIKSRSYDDTRLLVKGGEGKLRGLLVHDDRFVTGVDSGLVKIWNVKGKQQGQFDIRHNIHRMRQNPSKPWLVAIGGRESDLKIWDVQTLRKKPVFRAVNVPNDFLNLRIPVWVMDMRFILDSDKIVTCTGHSHIRVYDPNSPDRRPVINMEFDEYPLTALSLTHSENQVIVANSHGRMGLFDLRRKLLVHCYKGFAGSIRCVETHPTLNLVASCGLDRFLRVHDINTRILLHKVYLKSRLNCLLLSSHEPKDDVDVDRDTKLGHSLADENPDDKAVEEMWNNMEEIIDNIDNFDHRSEDNRTKKSVKRKRKDAFQKSVKTKLIPESIS